MPSLPDHVCGPGAEFGREGVDDLARRLALGLTTDSVEVEDKRDYDVSKAR